MAAKVFTKKRQVEYEQICATYRQGVSTLFDTFKFFIVFQAGIGTVAGAIFSRTDYMAIKTTVFLFGRNISVSLPLFGISLVGCSTAVVAPLIAMRLYRYHNTLVDRAKVIERDFEMSMITDLGKVWDEGNSYRGATRLSLGIFIMMAALWFLGVVLAFK